MVEVITIFVLAIATILAIGKYDYKKSLEAKKDS